jgi:hypothetical protein
MNFIERLLGLAPDSGTGLLEASLIAIAVLALVPRLFHILTRKIEPLM